MWIGTVNKTITGILEKIEAHLVGYSKSRNYDIHDHVFTNLKNPAFLHLPNNPSYRTIIVLQVIRFAV